MQKKLTITIDERVYNGLHTVIGRPGSDVWRLSPGDSATTN